MSCVSVLEMNYFVSRYRFLFFISWGRIFFFILFYIIYSRGVTVHKYDGSVRTSVLTSLFGMISVQQGEKTKHKIAFLLNSGLLNKLLSL